MSKLKINEKVYRVTNSDIFIPLSSLGFSALGMAIMLLIISMLLITGLSQSALYWRKNFINNQLYYQRFNQAQSAIEWGITQSWPKPNLSWQCQFLPPYELTACIKKSTLSNHNDVMIKGQFEALTIYHLAQFNHGRLSVERGHWLDYCPENRSSDCD